MCSLLPLNLVESDAPSTFSKWGNAIRAQFALDNLELTSKATDPGIGQLVATVQSLGWTVGGMHAQLASMQREFALLRSAPTSPAAASPRRRSTPPRSAPSPLRAQPVATNDDATNDEEPPPPPPQQPPRPAFGSLLPSSGQKATSLTGVRAAEFYEECMAKGGVVPHFEHKQQKPKAEICIKWFNSMATDEEKAVLKPPKPAAPGEPEPRPDQGQRRTICTKLSTLVVQLLVDAYEAENIDVPRDFLKQSYALPASGVSTHATGILKQRGAVPDTSTFAAWRKAHEEREAAEHVAEREAAGGAEGGRPTKRLKK